MIEKLSIGIDIVDINRFKKLDYKKNSKFYKKIFAKSEIDYCLKYRNFAEHFAGKFAVKEAVNHCFTGESEISLHVRLVS